MINEDKVVLECVGLVESIFGSSQMGLTADHARYCYRLPLLSLQEKIAVYAKKLPHNEVYGWHLTIATFVYASRKMLD